MNVTDPLWTRRGVRADIISRRYCRSTFLVELFILNLAQAILSIAWAIFICERLMTENDNLLIKTAELLTVLFENDGNFLTNHTIGFGTFVCFVTIDGPFEGYRLPKNWRDLCLSGSITINSLSEAGQVFWTEPNGESRTAPWIKMAFVAENGEVAVLGRYTTPGHRFGQKRLQQFAAWIAAATHSPLDWKAA